MNCILTNTPGFKELANLYGEDLAKKFIIDYSVNVKKVGPNDEYYYPSKTELSNYLTADKNRISDTVVNALKTNPFLTDTAFKSLLKGVVHSLKGNLYVTRGFTNYGSMLEQKAAEELIFKPNVAIVDRLAKEFPNIVTIRKSESNAFTVQVEIKPIVERANAMSPQVLEQPIDFNESFTDNPEQLKKERAQEIAARLGDKFAKAFNIPYTMITAAEAEAVLENTKTPYQGEAAFYYNDTVYFVGDKLTTESVLHEYAHPLIKGIAKMNPGLFNKLYYQLRTSSTGVKLIENVVLNYPELEFESDRFKEEVIVNALEKAAMNKVNGQIETEEGFKQFIQNILFAIKKLIKQLVGKVNLDKLSVDTTLDQLANMMVNEDFQIDNLMLEPSDFAEFKKDISSLVAQFNKVDVKDLQKAINDVYAENMYELDILSKTPKRLKDLLESKEGAKFLRYIADDLRPYQTVFNDPTKVDPQNAIKALKDQQEEFKLRSLALMNSIGNIEVFVENIEKALSKISGDPKKIKTEEISKIMYYKDFLSRQEQLVEDVRTAVGLNKETDFVRTLNGIMTSVRDAKKKINEIEYDFAGQYFEKKGEIMAENIDEKFREDITRAFKADNVDTAVTKDFIDSIINKPLLKSFNLEDYNLPLDVRRKGFVTKIVQQYNDKRLNREQYEAFLKGERGDIGYFASMIIPIKNIDDPIVGTFARDIAIAMSDVNSKLLKERDSIASKIDPLLQAAGYNSNNVGALAKQLLLTDKDGYRDSNGDWIEYERFGYHDKFKNWRYDLGKLKNDFENAKDKKDKDLVKSTYAALIDFEKKYMHRPMVDEYYEKYNIWTQDNKLVDPFTKKEITVGSDVSFQAYLDRAAAIEKMTTLRNVKFEEREDMLEATAAEEARMEYERLYDVFYPDGTQKTGEELQKALVMKHYRSVSRKFMTGEPDVDSLQHELNNYVDKLAAKGITMEDQPDLFNEELERFFKKNMRIAYTDKYIDKRNDILAQIRQITDKPGLKSEIAKKRADLMEERYNIIGKTTDKNRQVNGIQLTEQQRKRIKEIEVELVELEDQFDKKTGMSKQDVAKLKDYQNRINNGPALTDAEKEDYNELINIKNDMGLGPLELEKLRTLFRDLSEISYKEPTDYYIAAINYALRGTELEEVNIDNADDWINSAKVLEARTKSDVFDKWFVQNHYSKEVWDNVAQQKVTRVFRTAAWNVAKPSDQDSYKKTVLIHPITKEQITRLAVPGGKYNKVTVKEQYVTPRTVGQTVDNRGNYLPKEYNPGQKNSAFDNKYVNQEYYDLKRLGSPAYKLLEAIKEEYLRVQEDKGFGSKLYYDYANFFHRSNQELLQSGKAREQVGEKLESAKYFGQRLFGKDKTPDAAEWMFNYNAEATAIGTDILGNPLTRIPIRGMYRLKKEDVSMDFLRSFYDYMESLNVQKKLSEIEPVAKLISDVLNNSENAIKDMSKISKQILKSKGALSFIPVTDNKRAKTFDYFVDKIFYGKVNADFNEQNVRVTKIANAIMGASSRSFIAMDMVSAAKNRYGMVFQSLIESAGMQYITPKSLALGKFRAYTATIQLMTKDIYKHGPKSLDAQMMEYFDPITGKTKKDFSKSASRTFIKDMMDGSWMFDVRRLAEVEAGLEVFWGMMYNKYIDQTDSAGNVQKIRYSDAFELGTDGIIKLKDGIDLEWGMHSTNHIFQQGDSLESVAKKYNVSVEDIKKKNEIEDESEVKEGDELIISDNTLFNDFKLKVQGVGKKLNGLLDEFDSPQANKYLGWRMFSFYRLFALPMFLNRFQMDTSKQNFGGDTYDFNLGTLTKGYYISGLQYMYKTLKSRGKYLAMATDEEKASLRKMLSEGMMLAILGLSVGLLFGYDEDDEDRFEKLRKRQKEWGALGYLSNHLLLQVLAVKSENELFVPFVGFDDFANLLDQTSLATGPVIGNSIKILQDLYMIATGDDGAIYKQDVGPYWWQEEGDYKLWNHIGGVFGVKGKNYDPVYALKSRETFQNLN